jgi:hypothetical protein
MDVMTFILPTHQPQSSQNPLKSERLTLSPFTPTPRHLTLDQFQGLQLQHRVIDSQHPFQDLLNISPPSRQIRDNIRPTEDLY